ncbi:hypothetical protein [Enterococcus faecalis]|uniref:hypothetical protein n=1 Tax=Enterococcus faecalis TaxID=1351 RepID=UPI001142F17F|nr:hypothetical protein [Enterococcus faecalis]EHK9427737.1 hypothetical protein [Enterococcus faecalis]MDV7801650.1 hypothetical protein [Enterococcus faecalis]NSW06846.1 hypothetical protein [Enterococcus faecalis]TQB35441.1 hypothetical protein FKY90_13730 [Enterococcus faecalis]
MDQVNKVLEKLMDQTAKNKIIWLNFLTFPSDDSLPYYGHQHLVPSESYLYNYSPNNLSDESGHFFLATFKVSSGYNNVKTELVFGFVKSNNDPVVLSKDQEKLFELKALIEYEEPSKNVPISDILNSFLNNED